MVLALLSLGVVLLWRTRALLTLAIAIVLGATFEKTLSLEKILWCMGHLQGS